MNDSEEFGYIVHKDLFWLNFMCCNLYLLWDIHTFMIHLSLGLLLVIRGDQNGKKQKKKKYFLTNPIMQSRLRLLPLLSVLLQQSIILPASVFFLIPSLSLSLADSAHYDQISNHLLSPRQDCGDSLFCGAPDVWGTLGGWLNEVQNNESPAALPMPLDDGKTETLPPVPVPEGIPQQEQEQQQLVPPPESQNPTLRLPGSQVEMDAPLTGTEGCTAFLPQVNPEEWDAHVRVVFYLMLFFFSPLYILSRFTIR